MLDIDCKILKIINRNKGKIKLKTVQETLIAARGVRVPLSTINSSIERLEKEKYVDWVKYYHIKLTKKGKNLADELIRHAQLLEMLLYNELELDASVAHSESEKFNLLLSCHTIKKICEKYEHPLKSPCGESIANSTTCYCESEMEIKIKSKD